MHAQRQFAFFQQYILYLVKRRKRLRGCSKIKLCLGDYPQVWVDLACWLVGADTGYSCWFKKRGGKGEYIEWMD